MRTVEGDLVVAVGMSRKTNRRGNLDRRAGLPKIEGIAGIFPLVNHRTNSRFEFLKGKAVAAPDLIGIITHVAGVSVCSRRSATRNLAGVSVCSRRSATRNCLRAISVDRNTTRQSKINRAQHRTKLRSVGQRGHDPGVERLGGGIGVVGVKVMAKGETAL